MKLFTYNLTLIIIIALSKGTVLNTMSMSIAIQPDAEEKPVSFDDVPSQVYFCLENNKNIILYAILM